MKEKIKEIREFERNIGSCENLAGFQIETTKQVIEVGIDDDRCCCESWGMIWSVDDYKQFEGSFLKNIEVVDTALNKEKLAEEGVDINDMWFEGNLMFINFETARGLFQLAVYNKQNGYYGHKAYIKSNQINKDEYL